MRALVVAKALGVAAGLLLGSCCAPSSRTAIAPHSDKASPRQEAATLARAREDALRARAAELMAQAREVEPALTPLLLDLARVAGAEMYKLEFRFKAEDSLLRKMRTIHTDSSPEEARGCQVDDALRYTMRIEDDPAGHHVETARKVLDELEKRGHRVVRLKNYWPGGDNYSGVNTVVHAPQGLQWELQFHTHASLEAAAQTRADYEEMRRDETPPERKRELFDRMSRVWTTVPVPQGILQPGALHPREQILQRTHP